MYLAFFDQLHTYLRYGKLGIGDFMKEWILYLNFVHIFQINQEIQSISKLLEYDNIIFFLINLLNTLYS